MKKEQLLRWALMMGLPGWSPLVAVEYHVAANAPNAADTNLGTLQLPWKTLAKGASVAQAGDTVLVHAGVYPESVTVKNRGDAGKPITFRPFENDEVILDGADPASRERWQLTANSKNIYRMPLERDPGIVLVDGDMINVKIDPVSRAYPRTYKRGILSDADRRYFQYDSTGKQLLLNLGGDTPARHAILVPVRAVGMTLGDYCTLQGFCVRHYTSDAVQVQGQNAIVRDCVVAQSGNGIVVGGWETRGVLVQRNTAIDIFGHGIILLDRPAQCLVEDNLAIRCTLNPLHETSQSIWLGSIKMNSASDCIFANNVVLEAGNPNTDEGHDGWGLWGDVNIVHVMYLGNTCANNKAGGLYIEFGMSDTRAYFNTLYANGNGITCRASQRGVFMRNLVLENRTSGLAAWAAEAPYPTIDHVFSHNLVRDCNPDILLQTEQPNLSDYNTYWFKTNAVLAQGQSITNGPPRSFTRLADWVRATGHDVHSRVRDLQPADVGLDTVTFRVADSSNPSQILMMVGNGACDYEDPGGQTVLPYFWRPGTGDGLQHTFKYSNYCGLEGGIQALAYPGSGGTVALHSDSPATLTQRRYSHGGLRCLKVTGQTPAQMCPQGLGFWSPSIPARSGDVFDVGYFLRSVDLKTAFGSALVFAEFTTETGQHHRQTNLLVGEGGRPLTGTAAWQKISIEVRVPERAKRMRIFFGLKPATGTLLIDDITIKVR